MRQKEKDIIRNKKLLMDVATALFAKNGYHATKIDDIVNQAGFSKGTFYNYFKSKEAILVEILYENSQQILDGMDYLYSMDGPLDEILVVLNNRRMETFEKQHDFFKMVLVESFREGKSIPKGMRERMHEFFLQMNMKLCKIFSKYEHEFRSDLSIHEIAMIYMGINEANIKSSIHKDMNPENKLIDSEKLISVFLHGVRKQT